MFLKTLSKPLLFSACLLVAGGAWAADPSLHEVYQTAQAGRYDDAQRMMDQVLRDHPNSAKAHFVEAELQARQGKLTSAQAELGNAQRLDSSMSFATPEAIQELKSLIASPRAASVSPAAIAPVTAAAVQPAGSHMPWGLIVVGGAVLFAGLLFFRSRNGGSFGSGNAGRYGPAGGPGPYSGGPAGPGYNGGPNYAPGYGGGYPAAGGGLGSGIVGSLATGAAVGAGVVAGEALMHRVLDGSSSHDATQQNHLGNTADSSDPWQNLPGPTQTHVADNGYDMGGSNFGVNDAGSWDNDTDFGSGGGSDDWT